MSKSNKELVSELTIAYISSWERCKTTMTTTSVTTVFNTFKKLVKSMDDDTETTQSKSE